eukprot:c53674_g1_i1.p1 GENE.c53674_g1_i1~~c53674_g1_i1.p1  ORF type:complete len:424 (-),score=103.55 c53674_g1_i1:413-1645(-)
MATTEHASSAPTLRIGSGDSEHDPQQTSEQVHVARQKFRNRTQSMTGETIYKDHPSHDIMLNIKLGVRHSIGQATTRENRELVLADFTTEFKKSFPSEGSSDTPPHRSGDFKFKDHAPLAFKQIRERFGIDAADYMLSIGGDHALKEIPTPGKSGALFYKTKDDRFLIKTISKQESKYFRDILAQYYNHVQMHVDTLLPRFFQLFRIQTKRGRFIRMVVMHNILPSHLYITERYDLKGSTFGRRTPQNDRTRTTVTLKDLDFVELGKKIVVGPEKKRVLFEQLRVDCQFLQEAKLMDYSLLVGVKVVTPEMQAERERLQATAMMEEATSESPRKHKSIYAFDGALECFNELNTPTLAYFGVIDILQEYDMSKRMEHLYKGARYDPLTISAVSPAHYAQRFVDYLQSKIFF